MGRGRRRRVWTVLEVGIGVLAVALTASGAAAAARGPGFFQISRLHVRREGSALVFQVALAHVAANDRPTLAWSLAPTGGAACENMTFPGGTRSRRGLVVWDQQGPTFRWDRGSGRCAGTVSVVAENQYVHCTSKAAVTLTGVRSAAPACALGGYAIGFSTLPVPAGVFRSYGRMQAELTGPPRSASAAARQIRRALQAQTSAFALFPPVWFCSFQRIFPPIVAVRSDLSRGASTAATRDARAAAGALARCAPAPVRAAFRRLAASPSSAAFGAALGRYFPPVFGFRFGDLVDRTAAEDLALAAAESAAAAGRVGVAARQAAIAGRAVGAIGGGLDRYQRHVEKVENANG
jgi:hypothetical protein